MIRIAHIIPLAAIALAVSVACGGSEETSAPTAPAEPTAPSAEAPAPAESEPAAAEPTETADTPAAEPAASPDVAEGKQLYATYCASCHGAGGEGDGPVAAGLDPKPAKHTNGEYMNALSNEHLFKVTKEGGPAVGKSPLMAPWGGTLSDAQIWDVVAFMRSLAEPAFEGSVP
jgi:mono/diheme cytochrome c family protein